MPQKTLILIGWDGADWKIAKPLMDAGKLPQLQEMVSHGASGDLRSMPPYLSPMLWNTIATGHSPAEHGIIGFTEFNSRTQAIQPMSSTSRRRKAIWNILSQENFRTHVVGWFASHPAERINGVTVAETFGKFPKTRNESSLTRGSVFPEEAADALKEIRVSPKAVEKNLLTFFIPCIGEIDLQRDHRPAKLLERLSELYTYHNAAIALMQDDPPNFLSVYYHFIDWICHDFMVYTPPQRPEISERDFALYSGVVDAAYQLQDLLLRDLLHHAPAGRNCMLISDHGFLSGAERPARTPGVSAGIAAWHRNYGIFAAAGPLFASGQRIDGASLFDITPTLLHAFDLPKGEDMPGRILTSAFRNSTTAAAIPSWESRGPSLSDARADELSPQESADLLRQFEEMGYVELDGDPMETAEARTQRDNAWNLGTALMGERRYADALPYLEEAFYHNPERVHIAVPLAKCQILLGLTDEAAITARCLQDYAGVNAEAHLHLAELARLRGELEDSLQHLDQAASLGLSPKTTDGVRALVLLMLERFPEAEMIYRRLVQQDLDPAWLGLSRVLFRMSQLAEAEAILRSLLARNASHALTWFTLGQVLEEGEKLKEANVAYDKAIQVRPDFPMAEARKRRSERLLLETEGYFMPYVLGNDFKFDGSHSGKLLEFRENMLAQLMAGSASRHAQWQTERNHARSNVGPVPVLRPKTPPTPRPDQAPIVVVSGLPRSGTSLMMQMLTSGGLAAKTDDQRKADQHNPKGYFEWDVVRQLAQHPERIDEAAGMAVKIVSAQLPQLLCGRQYRIIWMNRSVEQVATSQEIMLRAKNEDRLFPPFASRVQALREHRDQIIRTFRKSAAEPETTLHLLELEYAECVQQPDDAITRLVAFLGDLLPYPEAMADAVDPTLHRNRT